ncbi:MAG: hypothetical protein NTX75_04710 [Proteobacteria bacterium]|nr:hypothetical protein [Pseudomonadota bacterium]
MKKLSNYLTVKNLLLLSILYFIFKTLFSIVFVQSFTSVEDYVIAINVVMGNGYCYYPELGPTAFKTPVYPLFLALIISFTHLFNKLPIVIVQHLLLSIVPYLLYKLSKLFLNEKQSIMSGLLFMICPTFFYYSNVIEVTNLFIPVFISWAIVYLNLIKQLYDFQWIKYISLSFSTKTLKIILPFLTALVILTQPVAGLVIAVGLFAILYKRSYGYFALSVCIIAMLISPWVIRNYIVFDRFVPTKTSLWLNFYAGYFMSSHGSNKYKFIPDSVENKNKYFDYYMLQNEIEFDQELKKEFIGFVIKNPYLYLEKTVLQMYLFWTFTQRYINDYSLNFLISRRLPVYFLNIFFVIGMFFVFRQNKPLFWILLFIFLNFTLVYGLTQMINVKYKLDIEWLEFLAIAFCFKKLE